LAAIDGAARDQGIGAIWAPHFRLAGVLMMHFARIAARYMSSVEILEGHHAGKADSPSGTARELARMIRDAHGSEPDDPPVRSTTVDGVRGGRHEGVRIHSVRLPSDMGWHEILFGGPDEVLTIRHDEFDRKGYVATVSRAVHEVMRPDVVGLIRGYDAVIGLGG
jgi:4-hydroxy-tetrahydrodipicolinate reductase